MTRRAPIVPPKAAAPPLLVAQKMEEVIEYGYLALKDFPRTERHVMSQEIRLAMWSILRGLLYCSKYPRHRTPAEELGLQRRLRQLDGDIELLRCPAPDPQPQNSGLPRCRHHRPSQPRPRHRLARLSPLARSSAPQTRQHSAHAPSPQSPGISLPPRPHPPGTGQRHPACLGWPCATCRQLAHPPAADPGPGFTAAPGSGVAMGLTVRVGVEPTEPRGSLVFKTSAIGHSATSPKGFSRPLSG